MAETAALMGDSAAAYSDRLAQVTYKAANLPDGAPFVRALAVAEGRADQEDALMALLKFVAQAETMPGEEPTAELTAQHTAVLGAFYTMQSCRSMHYPQQRAAASPAERRDPRQVPPGPPVVPL